MEGKFTDGQKFYWQADTENADSSSLWAPTSSRPTTVPPNRAVRLTDELGQVEPALPSWIPRFCKLASKAWKWLPLKPAPTARLRHGVHPLDDRQQDASTRNSSPAPTRPPPLRQAKRRGPTPRWLVALDPKSGEAGRICPRC